jgi:ABC-2 type transport system ATP-binding protein
MAQGDIIVETQDLHKVYKPPFMGGSRSHLAVNKLNINVRSGEVFGLVGPNGSGKTTTLKLLLGLLNVTSGKISVFGETPRSVNVKHRIGFLPDGPYFYDHLNADELLDYYGRLFSMSKEVRQRRANELLGFVGLTEARHRRVREYSKGMVQRIGLAQALINDPDLLFLDEPTTGLDPIGSRQMKEAILQLRKQGKTVFLCSHLLADVQAICDRVAILNEGNLVRFGTVEELLGDTRRYVVTAGELNDEALLKAKENQFTFTTPETNGVHLFNVIDADGVTRIVDFVRESSGKILSIEEKMDTLEDVFVRAIRGE